MRKRKRVVFTVAGSESDVPQLVSGLSVLDAALAKSKICRQKLPADTIQHLMMRTEVGHFTISGHRNTAVLLDFLQAVANAAKEKPDTDFVLVMAAGWAAILPGLAAAFLYYCLKSTNVFVVGVALEYVPKSDEVADRRFNLSLLRDTSAEDIFAAMHQKQRRDLAALLSVSELPGTKMLVSGDKQGPYFGAEGFKRACRFAVSGEIPDELRRAVSKVEGKPPSFREWQEATAW